jgi:hypothetical protein
LEVTLVRPHKGNVLPVDHPAEPRALHLGHVPDQTEQRKCRGRHRLTAQVLVGETVAFHGERRAMVVEKGAQHLALARDQGWANSFRGHF